jgi:A/G-specific adenine glycosylase
VEFSSHILLWYYKNLRNLPWRESKDPYKVWISEIILQQTRVAQGLEYYNRFITTFPNIKDLAIAKENEVLKLWQGLGYYSRARNIHFTAKHIFLNLNNVFPTNYKELLKLKGIGPYTASAISSICFNEKRAAVDGNVYRVLARVYDLNTPINSSKGIKEFQNLADSLISSKNPGDYNQGIMELGATVCTPKKTRCNNCPLQSICIAYSKNTIDLLPVKEKKIKIKNRYLNYYCIENEGKLLINRREENDIWYNLYDFPVEEIDSEELFSSEAQSTYLLNIIGRIDYSIEMERSYKHKLSHQNLHINIQHIKTRTLNPNLNYALLKIEEILELPVPKPIEKFISELL